MCKFVCKFKRYNRVKNDYLTISSVLSELLLVRLPTGTDGFTPLYASFLVEKVIFTPFMLQNLTHQDKQQKVGYPKNEI